MVISCSSYCMWGFFSRCILILNARPIIELLWTFPKVTWVAGYPTLWPETNWSCSLCSASRPATTSPSSNTDRTAKTGSSLTAWQTDKVSSLLLMSQYMHHLCNCFIGSAEHCVQERAMASTSRRFTPALRSAHTWKCLPRNWPVRCLETWRVWPNVSFVTPTCTCIRAPACVSIAEGNLTGKPLSFLLRNMSGGQILCNCCSCNFFLLDLLVICVEVHTYIFKMFPAVVLEKHHQALVIYNNNVLLNWHQCGSIILHYKKKKLTIDDNWNALWHVALWYK